MKTLGPEARSLVDAGRAAAPLSPARRERNRAAIAARVAAGAVVSGAALGALGTSLGGAPALGAATKVKLATFLVLLAGVGAVSAGALRSAKTTHGSALGPPPAASGSGATPSASNDAQSDAGRRSSSPDAARSAPSPAPPIVSIGELPPAPPAGSKRVATLHSSAEPTVAEDAQLLRDVDAALQARDHDRALALLDARSTGPGGAMREERDAARLLASCARRPDAAARAEAERFAVTHPGSLLVARVRAACAAPGPVPSDPP